MKPANFLAIAVLAAALAACSKGEDKKAATQIAAKVNKSEISVHQINQALSRAGNIPPEQVKAATRQALDRLIDQELFVQQAHEKKLDRDPRVMQALEAARREILARAYADQVMANASKPGSDEIHTFYTGHPELFADRRIYNLEELAVRAKAEQLPALQQAIARSKSFAEVAAWLKEQNIPFAANAGLRPAEQLPLELLPHYHAMKDGQVILIGGPNGAIVAHLLGSQASPRSEKDATPFIEQFLQNRKRAELAAAEVKALKAKAKIEYQGDFGPPEAAGEAAASAAPAASTPAAPAAEGKPAEADSKHIEKGIAGLK